MKCLINCVDAESSWLKDVMPGLFPHFLRILNKPLLEYFIDFCALNGIAEIRIVKSDPTAEMEHYFSSGPQKGLNISYVMGKAGDTLSKVLLKNSGFCQADDLLIIDGLFFLNYHKDQLDSAYLPLSEAASMRGGAAEDIYFVPAGSKFSEIDFLAEDNLFPQLSISALDSVQDYYQINQRILTQQPDNYFLPGYSNKSGEFIGKNVAFNAHHSNFEKPFMIGNDVQMYDNCQILANSVIGNNVIIDTSTTVSGSIVYDQTYLGSNLEINNKIVYKNYLIDAASGEHLQIADKFFISKINRVLENSLYRFIQKILAFLGLILGLIPYALGLALVPISKINFSQSEFYQDLNGNKFSLPLVTIKKSKFCNRWFIRFSLDKYPLLLQVLSGKLALVGNRPIPADSYGRIFLDKLDNYHPAVISYSEVYASNFDDGNFLLHEIFYNYNSSIRLMLKIIFLFSFNRLFSVRKYFQNGFFS
ncbi:MAG: hypothetical protein R6U84_01740 [Candidatus Cloacimonadales bacterium]